MFTTVNSFLFFFIPTTILFILGIIFEDKLIEFEDSIKRSFRKASKKKQPQRQMKQMPAKSQQIAVRPDKVPKTHMNKAA